MATTLIDQPSTRKGNTNNADQEYYNLYYSKENNCVFTPASKATANALDTDTVFKIVTNQLTNDVQFTTTKPYKKGKHTFTNFNVKVMPVDGEYKDKYVSVGFINYYTNDLTESSTEEEKALVIANLMSELENLKPEQVSKHLTTEDAKNLVSAL
jgi:hypothetical protein